MKLVPVNATWEERPFRTREKKFDPYFEDETLMIPKGTINALSDDLPLLSVKHVVVELDKNSVAQIANADGMVRSSMEYGINMSYVKDKFVAQIEPVESSIINSRVVGTFNKKVVTVTGIELEVSKDEKKSQPKSEPKSEEKLPNPLDEDLPK